MKTFNITRFHNSLLWQVVVRKRILINFAAFGLLFALIPMVFNIVNNFSHIIPMDWNGVASIYAMIMVAYLTTCGAFIVGNISDKNSRINAFLLPASKLEKFVSRYIFLLIAVPLAAFVGLIVGDIIQMPIYKILSGEASSLTYAFLYNMAHSYYFWGGMSEGMGTMINGIVVALYIHSILLLCGTFFHRHAWIKSNVLLLLASIVLSAVIMLIAKSILNAIYGAGNYVVYLENSIAWYVLFIIFFVFNYWAAYRIYSRMQAINNKWYNF